MARSDTPPPGSGEPVLRCSFCNKAQADVERLIAGPNVLICDECVQAYAQVVRGGQNPLPVDLIPATNSAPLTPCPSCGARAGGRAGCQQAFESLQARSSSSPVRASVHNLLVDVYAMQHTEEYGRSAKSYIAHLTALCCSLEASGDQKLYRGISRWLDGPTTLARPADISARGTVTIADAMTAGTDTEYADAVRRWARDVWAAYAGRQAAARTWLAEVRQHLASARGAHR